ncbi:MAG TPA: TOMM precursor leader peptide-binding protein [Pyrinomonadaceae bacterium]|jgi:bacteriocin biosynthesis cyclodehydratase domain-containing protein|nr:TOMM precursor leader peptide-binding protein [Pyrinomonadaceae bacterium]
MLKPKIKSSSEVIVENGDRYQIRSSEKTMMLTGATVRQVFSHLLPLLDGEHTSETIVTTMQPHISSEVVHAVIEKLETAGILEEGTPVLPANFSTEEYEHYRQQLGFFDLTLEEGSPVEAQQRLKDTRLSIVGKGELAASLARQAAQAGVGRIFGINLEASTVISEINPLVSFEAAHLPLAEQETLQGTLEKESPTLIALALDRPEPKLLDWINEISQSSGVALAHSQTHGTVGVVGPLAIPKQTACLTCYQLRVNSNLEFYDEYRAWTEWVAKANPQQRALPGLLPALTAMVASMTMIEIIKHVTQFYEPEIYNKFVSINVLTLEVISHQLLKLPRCYACGVNRGGSNLSFWQEPK